MSKSSIEDQLFEAVAAENHHRVRDLIGKKLKKNNKSNADLNFTSNKGQTLLHAAAACGSRDTAMIDLLIKEGVNGDLTDNNGFLPAHVACELAHSESMRCLLGYYSHQISATTKDGQTLLHLAVSGNLCPDDDLHFLLQLGVSVSGKNGVGETAFLVALRDSSRSEQACLLLTHLWQQSQTSTENEQEKQSFLRMLEEAVMVAAEKGRTSVLKLCYEYGCDVNAVGASGTALHCASKFGQIQTVKFLIHKGARTDIPDQSGESVDDILNRSPSDNLNKRLKDVIEEARKELRVDVGEAVGASSHQDELSPESKELEAVEDNSGDRSSDPYKNWNELGFDDCEGLGDSVANREVAVSSAEAEMPCDNREQNESKDVGVDVDNVERLYPGLSEEVYKCHVYTKIQGQRDEVGDRDEHMETHDDPSDAVEKVEREVGESSGGRPESTVQSEQTFEVSDQPDSQLFTEEMAVANFAGQANSSTSLFNFAFTPEIVLTTPDDEQIQFDLHQSYLRGSYVLDTTGKATIETADCESSQVAGPETSNMNCAGADMSAALSARLESNGMASGNEAEDNEVLEDGEDWIAMMLKSAGIEVDPALFAIQFEKDLIDGMMPETIGEWLLQIQLRHLEPNFINNGFDNINFIGLDVLTKENLRLLGVKDDSMAQKILTSKVVKGCGRVPKVSSMDTPFQSLEQWLSRLGLSMYHENFLAAGILEDLSNIGDAWQLALKNNKFGVSNLGHRVRLLVSLDIKDLKMKLQRHLREVGSVYLVDIPDDPDYDAQDESQVPKTGNEAQSTTPKTPMPTPTSEGSAEGTALAPEQRFFGELAQLSTSTFNVGVLAVVPFNDKDPSEENLLIECGKSMQKRLTILPLLTLQVNFCALRLFDPSNKKVEFVHPIPNIQCAALYTDHRTFAYVVAERLAAKVPLPRLNKGRQPAATVNVDPSQKARPTVRRLCYILQTVEAASDQGSGTHVMAALRGAFQTAFQFVNQYQPKSETDSN